MPNSIQINYTEPYLPKLLLFFLTVLCLFIIVWAQVYVPLLVALLVLIAWHYYRANKHHANALVYKNQQWFLGIDDHLVATNASLQKFICPFFLVVILTCKDGRQWPFYFSRLNCTEADYRFLCATLLK